MSNREPFHATRVNEEQFSDLDLSLERVTFNHFLLYLTQTRHLCGWLAFSELKLAAVKPSSRLSLPPPAERSYLQAFAVGNRVTSLPCLARKRDCTKAGSARHCAVRENILNISFAFLLPFFSFVVSVLKNSNETRTLGAECLLVSWCKQCPWMRTNTPGSKSQHSLLTAQVGQEAGASPSAPSIFGLPTTKGFCEGSVSAVRA
ncbi:uncharacterized protein LOC126052911 [Accipiter gentilis]|uniref:uncharacterized protein LOC126052911 n=1 Tax=Astur gentilis TaxID=8957 RepID=UPI00210FACD7|nr:uncharacterized protein LOC126052911 [Accipiter gentilis]